ncbi:isoleucine--tRNA ligase, cytoplasmic [Artemisia annua]|uniref:Isoleucine--tRNA ligase, cytoplasmic n=1 Tax=Artemisia annua TaxID=35608 RepID=A0A2U1NQF5_ARTAN|nr:isoleucine--tRNA ligase, cytoplasmic [Artemisia annua]
MPSYCKIRLYFILYLLVLDDGAGKRQACEVRKLDTRMSLLLEIGYSSHLQSSAQLLVLVSVQRFIAVEKLKDQLLANSEQTTWVPDFVKEKRFHNWLENARDWSVSRSRFWGTPLPIWTSDDSVDIVVIGSVEELERRSGEKVTVLHHDKIDHITIPSPRGREEFGVLHHVEDVFDCWFESGSMSYAYIHYPFENQAFFNDNFPGDFIAEGLDQTRGWFYTLMVLSTALFGKPALRNLICNGLILAEDGKKMSKILKNYSTPMEVIDAYGAACLILQDALRLYIINSPVVRAETLRFKEKGVYGVVKDVLLPWYNAYRFLVQNANRLATFDPLDPATLLGSANVLDQWFILATQSLVHFVRQEIDAYRLYTVVPYLLKFIDNLTNIYVRFNRKRLKGGTGEEECRTALSTLYHVTLFTYLLQYNWLYNHHTQLEMVVVHTDAEFLDDIAGKLREYILEELNVKSVVPCNDPLIISVLGKRRGKSMRVVAEAIKAMSQEDILSFEEAGEITIAGHCLKRTDIEIVRGFKLHDGVAQEQMDASGDGDVLVIIDLRTDDSLFEAGFAREVVNRVQKLRKKSALAPTDSVEVYFSSLDDDKSVSAGILQSQEAYIKEALGCSLLDCSLIPSRSVVNAEGTYKNISNRDFKITLSRSTPASKGKAIPDQFSLFLFLTTSSYVGWWVINKYYA